MISLGCHTDTGTYISIGVRKEKAKAIFLELVGHTAKKIMEISKEIQSKRTFHRKKKPYPKDLFLDQLSSNTMERVLDRAWILAKHFFRQLIK